MISLIKIVFKNKVLVEKIKMGKFNNNVIKFFIVLGVFLEYLLKKRVKKYV